MKLGIKLSFLFLFAIICRNQAQNLVPNPSFETVNPCPAFLAQLNYAAPWTYPGAHTGTSDLFNSCAGACTVNTPDNFFGVASPYHGSGYAGIIIYQANANSREYLQAPLNSPLVANGIYCLSFRVLRSSRSSLSSNNIGAHFSNSAIGAAGIGVLSGFVPQVEETSVIRDSATWTMISGQYTATGGESYITIGNFRSNAATTTQASGIPVHPCNAGSLAYTYYYIDSINLVLCSIPPIAKIHIVDSSLCEDECINYRDSSIYFPAAWTWSFPGGTPDNSTDQNPNGICYSTPGIYTTSLIVSNAFGSDTAYKTITVLPEDDCNAETEYYVPNSFTPNNDGLNDIFVPKGYRLGCLLYTSPSPRD